MSRRVVISENSDTGSRHSSDRESLGNLPDLVLVVAGGRDGWGLVFAVAGTAVWFQVLHWASWERAFSSTHCKS